MSKWFKRLSEWLYLLLGGASKEELEEMKRRLVLMKERANLLESFRDDLIEVCEELVKNIRSRSRGDVPLYGARDADLTRRLIELGIAEQVGVRFLVACRWRDRFEQFTDAEAASASYRPKE